MELLNGYRVVQLGSGLAAAVCGRLLADVGAHVTRIADDTAPGNIAGETVPDDVMTGDDLLRAYLNHGPAPMTDQMAPDQLAPDQLAPDQLAPGHLAAGGLVTGGLATGDLATGDLAAADLILAEGSPASLRRAGHDADSLRRRNASAVIVLISPFGQTGPDADAPACDLTLLFASGIARMLTGQVDDLAEAPIRPVGEQSAFIGGLAAACAGMHAALARAPAVIDVSIQEALATLAMTELTKAGLAGKAWSRRRTGDGNGATVCILPAADGYAAISPREEKQWAAWLTVMGDPAWGREPRFARKADRAANWDALHRLMSAWSRDKPKQWIADAAQAAHVPSFPLREPMEQLSTPQLEHRRFYRSGTVDGQALRLPGAPFGAGFHHAKPAAVTAGPLPLSGIRVLDFSWVIAGPTTTRYLAAMGAEVIKIEAPGRGDPGRGSELHTVLGQAKKAIVLDLKKPEAVAVATALAERSDILVENFATGVMDRLGLGADTLRVTAPGLIYVSASGMGRTGPEAHAVAYGTLLQCYAGFAGLNRHPGAAPRVGMAWLDPMCGLMLAFASAAAVWQRQRSGAVARIDLSMIEAMLWTMAEPLLRAQSAGPPQPAGNTHPAWMPHGAWPAAGGSAAEGADTKRADIQRDDIQRDDAWVALAAPDDAAWRALCGVVPALSGLQGLGLADRQAARNRIDAALAAWLQGRDAASAVATLRAAGVPAAQAATSLDLVRDPHLRARGFWEAVGKDAGGGGVLPGLPWVAAFGRANGPAPALGADTDAVLAEVLRLPPSEIARLRAIGAVA
ncbi:CaiB/BaiF CoA-transferase family protein [Rhodopila sp.]|jgi:crotonobetainyl-CoA:carnitine CoA-transferase CaiB-like acyl-CoA transferase|uniref:CaiB/BaiF CoA-transferase family protein n=1 Tax=Rhodopila sp. TaxID=2480087 RepID=UPI002C79D88D|nr:CoA transferase [Rhodopila sp.]HVZ09463.1 CoA transferase [Rhodopila sp.]